MRAFKCHKCFERLGIIETNKEGSPCLMVISDETRAIIKGYAVLKCLNCHNINRWQPNRKATSEMLMDDRQREAVIKILIEEHGEEARIDGII